MSIRGTPTLLIAGALIVAATAAAPALAAPWNVDAAHSQVNFSIKHFFTPVSGSFQEFEIELDFNEENPAASKVSVSIPVSSIDTGNERRDGHLLTGDFFEAETHPTITFESTSVTEVAEGHLVAKGPLTIKGVSREVELAIDILGVKELPEQMQERMGAKKVAGFSASTTIDRGDYGVGTGNYAATVVIGSDVEISIQVEANS